MYNKSICFFLFFLLSSIFCIQSNAQERVVKKLAIYAPKNSFSLPLIEKQLSLLEDENSNQLFTPKEIVNINDLLSVQRNHIVTEEALEKLLLSEDYMVSNSILQKIGKRIRQYDHYLQINTKSFRGFIEYSFFLYPILNDKANVNGRMLDIEKKLFTSRIFNHDAAPTELEHIINNALKDLFVEAHAIPLAKINIDKNRLNGAYNPSIKTLNAAVGDTIYLDAFYSIDKDTPKERLTYKWNRIIASGDLPDLNLKLIDQGLNCLLIPNEADKFKIELIVMDGVDRTHHKQIGKSSRDTLLIIAHDKPELQVFPNEVNSFYVQNLTENKKFTKPNEKIIIVTSGDPSKIITDKKRLNTYNDLIENSDKKNHGSYKTILSKKITYNNSRMNAQIPIHAEFSNGIYSETLLKVNHKTFYPYFIGVFWSQNEIRIKEEGIENGPYSWNETKVACFLKVLPKLDIGLGWFFKRQTFERDSDHSYTVSGLAEIDATWKFIQTKKASLAINGFTKTFLIKAPNTSYTQQAFGLKGQVDVVLLQGLSEMSFNIPIISTPYGSSFIADYTQWWGFGLKVYIPNF